MKKYLVYPILLFPMFSVHAYATEPEFSCANKAVDNGAAYNLNVGDCTDGTSLNSEQISSIFNYTNVELPGGKMINITFPSTLEYRIDKTINVDLTRTTRIFANDAVFASLNYNEGVNRYEYSNMFSFTADNPRNKKLAFHWFGGTFDLSDRKVSISVPWREQGTQTNLTENTTPYTDAVSMRFQNRIDNTGSNTNRDSNYACYNDEFGSHVRQVIVAGITIKGANINIGETWKDAGGDSGIFLSGSCNTEIRDSNFQAIRDSAIYLSDDKDSKGPMFISGTNPPQPAKYLISRLTIKKSASGIAAKRGLDNVTISGNTIQDTVIGIGTAAIDVEHKEDEISENIIIQNNVIESAWHGIRAEWMIGSKITDNQLRDVGITSPFPAMVFRATGIRVIDPYLYNQFSIFSDLEKTNQIEDNMISGYDFDTYSFNGYYIRDQ